MKEEKLTSEQIKRNLDEVLKTTTDKVEKKTKLLQLRCRHRQLTYYENGDVEGIINEELQLIDDLDKLTNEAPEETFLPKAKARMKVIASTCMVVFRRAGVSLSKIDAARIARLISFLSGYSENTISQYLRNETSFMPDDLDALQAQALLMSIGIKEKLTL